MASLNSECQACKLHLGAKTVALAGSGPQPCDILCVGETPAKEDDLAGAVGRSMGGSTLHNVLVKEAESRGLSFRVDHIVHCRVPGRGSVIPGNAIPNLKERRACVEAFLWAEVAEADPRIILALGATAAAGLLNVTKFSVGENRRKLFVVGPDREREVGMVVTFHPSSVLTNRNLFPYWVKDIRWMISQMKKDSI